MMFSGTNLIVWGVMLVVGLYLFWGAISSLRVVDENRRLNAMLEGISDMFQDAYQYQVRRGLASHGRGYVYLLKDLDVTGYCKIGRTNDPIRRIGHFDTMLPFRTDVLAVIETSDCVGLETVLHHQYADKRVRGEWFDLTEDDIAEIVGIN